MTAITREAKGECIFQQPGDDSLQAEKTCQDTDVFHSLLQI
jgi:hypothetical protein